VQSSIDDESSSINSNKNHKIPLKYPIHAMTPQCRRLLARFEGSAARSSSRARITSEKREKKTKPEESRENETGPTNTITIMPPFLEMPSSMQHAI
jgi:hypothetical protein